MRCATASILSNRYASDNTDLVSVEGCPEGFAPPSPPPPPPLKKKKDKKNRAAAATGGDLTASAPLDGPSPSFHAYVGGKVKARTPTFVLRLSPRLLSEMSDCSSRGIAAPEGEALCTLASRAGLSSRSLDEAHLSGLSKLDSKGWEAEIAKKSNKIFHPMP